MAYLRNWGDIQAWMQDCGIQRWSISRTQATQDNNNVFVYDKDKSDDENKLICERAFDRFAGDVLYLTGWRTKDAKTGGFSAMILYDKTGGNNANQTATIGGLGLYGVGGQLDIDGLTRDLPARIRNEYDRAEITRLQKQIDDERKQLRDEQREFEREKVGTIGILVDKFSPYLKAVAGKYMDLPKVAGVDADGDIELDIPNGKILKKNYVGKNIVNYDSMLVLSHFKGHAMGGYGGALKQLSIGCGSSKGKAWIHSAGTNSDQYTLWNKLPEQDRFLESMADAASSIVNYFNGNMAFINVMKNISVDCDCDANAKSPCMKDIGIVASLDPVAVDQACLDLIYNSNDLGKEELIKRIESLHGVHTIEAANELGFGTRDYELIIVE